MKKLVNFLTNNKLLVVLFVYSLFIFAVNIRINYFRYDNFDFGKFDLGNMSQMLWNTMNGRFMYLTDYFGTNLPRWAMSHVDPILLLFLPVFAIFPNSMTLVVGQLVLVIFGSLIVYYIAKQQLGSSLSGFIAGLIYLSYPALGFLTAWTGFHGVSAAIPFFLLAFYLLERMHKSNNFNRFGIGLFWLLLIILMSGKEQISLYIVMWGIFILFFRSSLDYSSIKNFSVTRYIADVRTKLGLSMVLIGALWFIFCFFVIIPANAHYRINGFDRFAKSLDLNPEGLNDVSKDNYFLKRYESFGDGYLGVALGILGNPSDTIRVLFGGDKLDNFRETLEPLGYLPFLYPQVFLLALPDFAINYLTTLDGVGTSEIYNHRVSMIIPVVVVSAIYAVGFLSSLLSEIGIKNKKLDKKLVSAVLLLFVLFQTLLSTYRYNNPVYLWFTQAIQKKLIGSVALAKTDTSLVNKALGKGDVVRITTLENKDRECAKQIVEMIPEGVSVSGPDYLGAHLGLRETYAIFPALYNEADYVIIDVFSKKILTILDADVSLVKDVLKDVYTSKDYDMVTGCGNLFVFRKIQTSETVSKLPLQERFTYDEKVSMEIFQTLTVVDYIYPESMNRGSSYPFEIVYSKKGDGNLSDYVLYTTLINNKTGQVYQFANLPSFAISPVKDWVEDRYYIESFGVTIPGYIDGGNYRLFVGMTNNIRNRSMYLGDIQVN